MADATLANQTPAGIRAVFAPKLDSLKLWLAGANRLPTSEQVHTIKPPFNMFALNAPSFKK